MKKSVFALTLVLFAAQAGFAKEASCDGSTSEMLECIGRKIEKQEVAIKISTDVLKGILEAKKADGDGTAEDYEEAKKNLDLANSKTDEAIQAQCRAEQVLETPTGSLGRLVAADCVLRLKTQRANTLRKLIGIEKAPTQAEK